MEGRSFERGRSLKNFHQKVGAHSKEAHFREGALDRTNTVITLMGYMDYMDYMISKVMEAIKFIKA